MINDIIIVDGHAHVYPGYEKAKRIIDAFSERYSMNPVYLGQGTVDDLRQKMSSGGIDYTVLANFAAPKIILDNNLWTLNMGKKYSNIIPLVAVHPEIPKDKVKLIEEYISYGARGIKIHSSVLEFDVNDDRLKCVFEYCNDKKIPIVYHCGVVSNIKYNDKSDLVTLMSVIDKYTSIPTVLTHMAEGNRADVIRLSKDYAHIYFDTSIAISGYVCIDRCHDPLWQNDNYVIDVINEVGSDRIIFGSDYPFGSPIHDANRFLSMNINIESKRSILGLNAKKLFKI